MLEKKTFFNKQNCIWMGILFAISGLAFWVRWQGIEHITADIETCLIPWSESMKTGYGPSILSTFDGDYNMPYVTVLWLLNYLPGRTIIKVKLFSILFDYLGAIAGGLIVAHLYERMNRKGCVGGQNDAGKNTQAVFYRKKKIIYFVAAYTAILFYPSAVLNGGYWGQCDMVYVTFLLYMIYALLKDKPALAMILLGCAFSFKLQAVLIVPVLVIYYWKTKRMSLRHVLLVPIVMELLCIPAIIGGCSVFVPFSVYLRQLGRYPYMYVFYPNIWAIFKDAPYYIFSNVANLSIIAVLGVFAVLVISKREKETPQQWLQYALWSVFFMMCFLPCMHERYGMLLEILAILYAFLDRKYGIYAVIIGAGSYISYLQVTFGKSYFDDKWIAIAYLTCLGFMTYQMLKESGLLGNGCENAGSTIASPLEMAESNNTEVSVCGNEKTADCICVFKWESAMIEFVNRYMVWIAFALLTIFAVVIRKPMMECMSVDYLPNLIEVEGSKNTTFYMTMMWLLTFFQEKPLFFLLKLVCLVGDLLAAALVAVNVYRSKGKLSALVAYTVMLYLPTTYLVSSIWGHVDSLAIAALALAWLINDSKQIRHKSVWCGICLGITAAVVSHYVVVGVILAVLMWRKSRACNLTIVYAAMFSTMLVLSLSGLFSGYTVSQCVFRLFTWNTETGWILYPVMLFVLAMCVKNIKWMVPAVVLQMVFLLSYGQFLYDQPIVPDVVLIFGTVVAAVLGIVAYRDRKAIKE